MKSKVSIIITTKNSDKTLEALLKSVKKQIYKNIEIIVIDNNSSDNTVEIAKKFTNKVFQKGPERSSQRNYGASKASGEFFLFLDSDMILTKNVVLDCVRVFTENFTKNLGGVIIPEKSFGEGIWAKAKILERKINSGEDYFEAARFFPKKVFSEFKGYDKTLTGPEDWDLPQRINKKYQIIRIKSTILHNEGNLSLKKLFEKKFYYGLSVHKYLKRQNLPIFGPTTIYFFRGAFYKKWKELFKDPLISLDMILMLLVELMGGGLGYIIGRIKNGR